MVARRGLGRGLGHLIPQEPKNQATPTQTPSPVLAPAGVLPESALREVPVGSIEPNPHQPRAHFDESALAELAASIKEIGVLQPLLVRQKDDKTFQLIAGERRWRAAQQAGLQVVPVVVREADELASVEQALVENLHRADLTALEESSAYQQLVDDFGLTHEKVAKRVGKGRSAITNSLRLLTLPPMVQGYLADGRLSAGHAKAILALPDRASQERIAMLAVKGGWSVRTTEDAVKGDSGRIDTGRGAEGKPLTTTALRPPGLLELERLLGEFLSTSVSVTQSGKRGRIGIEFADFEDLERIYRRMIENSND